MTLEEMKTTVYRRLRESSLAPVFWTDDEITQAINDGYMEMSDASEWYERWTTVDLLNDRPYYDARTVLGESFLRIGAAFNATTDRWLEPVSHTTLDRSDRRWETAPGQPQRILTRGLWWLGYWPRVQEDDAGTIKQYWVGLPEALADDDDEPGFPEPFHVGCVEFAMTDLQAQDGQTQAALRAWSAYLSIEAQLVAWVADRASIPMDRGYVANAR